MSDDAVPVTDSEFAGTVKRVVARVARTMDWSASSKPRVNGLGPGDIVAMAFQSYLDGKRRWNRAVYASFQDFLFSAGRSVLSNERDKAKKSFCEPLVEETAASRQPSAEAALSGAEERERVLRRFEAGGIPRAFLELWLENPGSSNREISRITQTSVREVENAKRRLRRYLTLREPHS